MQWGACRLAVIVAMRLFAALAFIACASGLTRAQQPCPRPYVTDHTVATALKPPAATRLPDDACPEGSGKTQLDFFDDYSWRTFIALVWPALSGERGVPDAEQRLEVVPEAAGRPSGPSLVFETYKADWETFRWDGEDPESWSRWEDDPSRLSPAQMTCTPPPNFSDFFLAPSTKDYSKVTYPDGTKYPDNFGKIDNLMQFNLPFGGLVAQNGTLVRYLAAYNQIEFNQILAKKWYLAKELPDGANKKITFLLGSLSVKSAWVDMAYFDSMGQPHYTIAQPETFHRRLAWLYDPFTDSCTQHVVGLVGLHIVQKTHDRPAWIWATFEHVCNAPDRGQSPICQQYTFNNGNPREPMPDQIPDDLKADAIAKRVMMRPASFKPVNVERIQPINQDSNVGRNTQKTNKIWQESLRQQNSVWQYYQLVMTQWPISKDSNGAAATTIPGAGFNHSAIANTTLETWGQTDTISAISTGCTGCHRLTLQNDHIDFVWSLHMNAWPLGTSSDRGVKSLLDLLLKGK